MGYFLRPIDLPAEYPGTTTRNEEDRSEERPSYLKTAGGKVAEHRSTTAGAPCTVFSLERR